MSRDAVGNSFTRWEGRQPDLPAVAVSGPGAREAIGALQAAGERTRRSVELIEFAAVEPARFGIACLGSRLLSGAMPEWRTARLTGADGKTFDDWRAEAGFEEPLDSVAVTAGHYAAFLELGVAGDRPAGIVTSFAAAAGFRVTVEGEGAGGALDEIAGRLNGLADCAVTGGWLEVRVEHEDPAGRDRMVAKIASTCRDTAHRRRMSVKAELLYMDPAGECGAEVVEALARAAARHLPGCGRVTARGRHNAHFLSLIAPAGMLLAANPADAVPVLAAALAELAGW